MPCSTCGTEDKPERGVCRSYGGALPRSDAAILGHRTVAAVGLAALLGPTTGAVGVFRQAIGRFREAGVEVPGRPWIPVIFGPSERDTRVDADEARPIFERLRARPYLDRLEEAGVAPRMGTDSAPVTLA